jgi:hypothetical protein
MTSTPTRTIHSCTEPSRIFCGPWRTIFFRIFDPGQPRPTRGASFQKEDEVKARGPKARHRNPAKSAGVARSARWPLGSESIERRVVRESLFSIALAIAAAMGAAIGTHFVERLVLALAAVTLFAQAFIKIAARRKAAREAGFVVLDDRGISRRQAAASTPLASWSAPFGVSLFVNKSGDRGLIAFTSEGSTRFLGVHVPAEQESSAEKLFEQAAARADDDALFSQGVESSLGASSAAELLRRVEMREPDAVGRAFLSSARGESILVERALLRIGEREIDLHAPLEWRPFLFHEVAGHVTTIYQATWVRQEIQGKISEIVLVAPLPATSEVRLSSSLAEPPPSRDARIAIERLFMPLVRRALEHAPRASRTSPPPARNMAPAKGGAVP